MEMPSGRVAWNVLAVLAVGTTLISLLPAQRSAVGITTEPCGSDKAVVQTLDSPCFGSCDPGSDCMLLNNTMMGNYTIIECGCATHTPTSTPTSTPTATPTSTPTNTPIPDGGACDDPLDCMSGNCVDDVCCDTLCDQPGQACDIAGQVGTCGVETAAAPVASRQGLWVIVTLLVAVGAFALAPARRRRESIE